jgi:hypothetical protein
VVEQELVSERSLWGCRFIFENLEITLDSVQVFHYLGNGEDEKSESQQSCGAPGFTIRLELFLSLSLRSQLPLQNLGKKFVLNSEGRVQMPCV